MIIEISTYGEIPFTLIICKSNYNYFKLKMVKEESIGHSKALIGAFFIQYFIYSLLYIAEACQYEKLRGKESGAHDVQKGDVQQMYEMDIRDVMKHEKGLSRSRSLRQNQ